MSGPVKVRVSPEWKEAIRILGDAAPRFKSAAYKATLQEAQEFRGHVIKNFTTGGAHADKPFKPLSAATMIIRRFRGFGGSKILMVSGTLRNSVVLVNKGGVIFVGVKRASGKGYKIAELHENGGGPFTQPMTPKQRRFLAAAFRSAGQQFGQGGGKGGGVISWRTPARPFMKPTAEKFLKPDDVKRRFWDRVGEMMGGDFGKA